MNNRTNCSCLGLMTNDSSSDESLSSDIEWDSFDIQFNSSFIEKQPQDESPEMAQLAAQFEQLSCTVSDESKPGTQLQPERIPQDMIPQVAVEVNPNANPPEDANISPQDVSMLSLDGTPQKDGKDFLLILRQEQMRLLDMASAADNYAASLGATPDRNNEYALEKLLHFSGLAKLLVSSKMGQFRELCLTNVKGSPNCAFPVTNKDLQGFWDMIYLQVPPLEADFAEIMKLKDNNWLAPSQTVPATSNNPPTPAGKQRAPPKRKGTVAKTQERIWRI